MIVSGFFLQKNNAAREDSLAKISIEDFTGSAQLDISGASLPAKNKLGQLTSGVSGVVAALTKPVTDVAFRNATFGASFENPSIALKGNTLDVKASVNSTLTVSRSSNTPLFGKDDYDPIDIKGNECWIAFELDTLLDTSVALPLPEGFGVCFEVSTAPRFATYLRIPADQAAATTLSQAIEQTLSTFNILDSPEAVLAIPQDAIYTSDLAGTVKVGGSWSLPLAVNQLSLADAKLPFNASISVAPALTVKVAGDIALTSEFNVRFRRQTPSLLYVGLYRKKGRTLEASFATGAGLGANAGKTDLINQFFTAVSPGIDTANLQPGDALKIQEVLKDSIHRSLAISLNAACSAALSDEAAIAYAIDISVVDQATKDAIGKALGGDWSGFSTLPNARKLRNVITDTLDTKFSLTVNLLGIYNYRSLADFVKTLRVLNNDTDGSVTITDTATASRIMTASTPMSAQDDQLRAALYEGFVATATYQALLTGIGVKPTFCATQDLLLYEASLDYGHALKQLNAGEVLGVMPPAVKTKLPSFGSPVQHARFAASRKYTNDDVLRFFFSDVQSLMPHDGLSQIGRQVLAGLLDPQDLTDQKRIAALQSDQAWSEMDANPAQILPPYYSDWYDVTMWAAALTAAAPLLADAIRYARTVQGDPTIDPAFMKKRAALAMALDGVTHNTHAAFEKAFAICAMSTLAGVPKGSNSPIFEAAWNSTTLFSNKPAPEIAAETHS